MSTTKRATSLKGTGIRQRSGSYVVRWRDGTGKQRQQTFRTTEAALKFNAQRRADAAHDRARDEDKASLTFAEYAERLLADKAGQVSLRHLADTEAVLRRYVTPTLGATKVGRITSATCLELVRTLQARRTKAGAGLSPATIRKAYIVTKHVLALAVREGALLANPAQGLTLPQRNAAPHKTKAEFAAHPLTAAQVDLVCAALDDRDDTRLDSLVVYFLANTGLRAAELAGLEVQDYDPQRATITVARTKTKHGGNGTHITKVPKTPRSLRTVPLHPALNDELKSHLLHHPHGDKPNAPLFPARRHAAHRSTRTAGSPLDYSQPIDPTTFLRRRLRPALAAVRKAHPTAGIHADTRLHDLRHSFGTNLVESGAPVEKVSRLMGHSSITTTMNLYVHLDTAAHHDVVGLLAQPRPRRLRAV